jgi:deoxyadenosine/deoxycytidine kinase
MNTYYKHIAIEGNIGSGKTTLARKLARDLKARLIEEKFSDNPFFAKVL